MKKLFTLILVLAGFVGTVSATDYSIGANEENVWAIKGQMTDNGNGSYSYVINLPGNYDNYLFTIFEGTVIESNWSNAYRPQGAGGNWGLGGNNTPTMVKGANDYVLSFPVSSTYARAIKVDFTPTSGACTVTKLIAVGSGHNGWSTTTDYLTETTPGSEIYSGIVALEVESDGFDNGYKFVAIENKDIRWYGNSNNSLSTEASSNATVDVGGYYQMTANFSNKNWTDPTLVTVPVTIGDLGYSTFSSAYPVDFTDVTDVTAYRAEQIATGEHQNEVLLKKVSGKIPAATGLVLKGDVGTSVSIPTTLSGESVGTNYLVASVNDKTITPQDLTSDFYYFLSGTSSANVGFYILEVGKTYTSAAGKAYYHTATPLTTTAARAAWIFEDETTQGINNLENTQNADVVYDLQGRVAKTAKAGLYIKNGKKVFVK